MNIKKILGKRIQEQRKKLGLTQEKHAEIIDIDQVSMSKIETGINYPTAENLAKIAKILETEVFELFISDSIKSNEELLGKINSGIEKISKDNKKLSILYNVLKSLI